MSLTPISNITQTTPAYIVTILLALTPLISLGATTNNPPHFKITPHRKTDRVDVQSENQSVTVTIHSPSGVSHATIERNDHPWPRDLKLRLHLRGLEQFRMTNGQTTLNLSVSTHDGTARVWRDDKEHTPLNANSSLWMPIRNFDRDGNPIATLPPPGGYFEIHLPTAFFKDNPQSITLNWIDFYRH